VEVLVAPGALAAEPASQQTSTIPIVSMNGPDPTSASASGLVESLGRPGRTVSGNTFGATIVATKSLELLKTVLPQFSRVAILVDKNTPAYRAELPVIPEIAQMLGLQTEYFDVPSLADVDVAFHAKPGRTGTRRYEVARYTLVGPRSRRGPQLDSRKHPGGSRLQLDVQLDLQVDQARPPLAEGTSGTSVLDGSWLTFRSIPPDYQVEGRQLNQVENRCLDGCVGGATDLVSIGSDTWTGSSDQSARALAEIIRRSTCDPQHPCGAWEGTEQSCGSRPQFTEPPSHF
jgi:hypothetical protein